MSEKEKAPKANHAWIDEVLQIRNEEEDKELKQLAKDLYSGMIFTSLHIRKHDIQFLSSIFMPLLFINEETEKKYREMPIGMFYEYYDKAGPRTLNGYPIFFSVNALSVENTNKVQKYYEKVKEAMDTI